MLRAKGYQIGRRRVRTLMRKMGIQAVYRQPRTSQKNPAHKVYPYLLRDLEINAVNQVWAMDTTYIPMACGFVYLTALIDVASRRVLAHNVAITLQADHAVDVFKEALHRYGAPQIVNTDQGSQFTAEDFTKAVTDAGRQLSMDGRGAWRDNVFIERFWRTIKYEEVYLKGYDTVADARNGIGQFIQWYNELRPHTALNSQTPHAANQALLPALKQAA